MRKSFTSTSILALIMLLPFLWGMTACSTTSRNDRPPHAKAVPQNKVADINIKLAMAYLRKGNMHRAKEKLLIAEKHGSNYPPVWYAMAYYYEVAGDLDQSKKDYQYALKLNRHDAASQNNYGTFLCRHKKYREAIEHFKLALKEPDYLNAAQAYENIGICALQIPDRRLAKTSLKRALQYDGKLPVSLIELSKLLYKEHHYRQAKVYMTRYAILHPKTPESLLLSWRVAKKLGDHRQSRKARHELLMRFPGSKQARGLHR